MRSWPSWPWNNEFEKFHGIWKKLKNWEAITDSEFDFFRNLWIKLLESAFSGIVKWEVKEYEISEWLKRFSVNVEESFESLCKEDKMIHVLTLIRDLKQKKWNWSSKYWNIRTGTTTWLNKIL
jgi:hypothetical protein